ncbi:MAG: hypothetical protein M1814_002663 [Vezdaea aestivalis]|nr:MAG: hypothetical protein M1814_002663 [Vezdaea aestivalis]
MPPRQAESNGVYSATYSNTPVYEMCINTMAIMRRRSDDYINATHILKVAGFDKPARTRVLEREVQKGIHEKIQGGYGKYQGTWVPLADGRDLAERNNVLDALRPIFDFVPGDRSPPPAPKHITAASNKPKVPRASVSGRKSQKMTAPLLTSEDPHSTHHPYNGDMTPDSSTMASGDYEQDDHLAYSQQSASRKRKRVANDVGYKSTAAELQHQIYGDALLDYFLLSDDQQYRDIAPPMPPPAFNINAPIDDHGYAALHWAAAMGDIDVCKDLINRHADTAVRSERGETPLIRGIMFTNNYEKQTMPKLVNLLKTTVPLTDDGDNSVFHHIAMGVTKGKGECTRYYQETIINKLSETLGTDEVRKILDMQNIVGDTALHIAARMGCKKVCRSLQGYSASVDIPNKDGELAGHMLASLYTRSSGGKRDPKAALSSSPAQSTSANLFANPQQSSTRQPGVASTVISTILPLIQEKTVALTTTIANEAHEKDDCHSEALSLLKNVQKQRDETRRAIFSHPPNQDDATSRAQREEVQCLEADLENSIEKSQWVKIREAFAVDSAALGPPNAVREQLNPTRASETAAAAIELLQAQEERVDLVRDMVKAAGMVGTDEKTAGLRKLLAVALGQSEEAVMGDLSGIEESLEDVDEGNRPPAAAPTY